VNAYVFIFLSRCRDTAPVWGNHAPECVTGTAHARCSCTVVVCSGNTAGASSPANDHGCPTDFLNPFRTFLRIPSRVSGTAAVRAGYGTGIHDGDCSGAYRRALDRPGICDICARSSGVLMLVKAFGWSEKSASARRCYAYHWSILRPSASRKCSRLVDLQQDKFGC